MNKIHLRHCMLFMFNLGKNTTETLDQITQAYGADTVSYATVKNWFKKFRNGEYDLEDKQRSGRPKETEDSELEALLQEDSTLVTRDMAKILEIDQSTVQRRLTAMGKVLKVGHSVPHQLSHANIAQRLNLCVALLSRHRRKSFLWRIVTGDEKWVYYENPQRKRSLVDAGQPSTSTPKPNLHSKKLLLCIWWDMKGVLYYELLKPGETITAQRYSGHLLKLSEKIKELRPQHGHSMKKIILLHDNATPHVAKATKNKILELGWEVLPHPAYSPDIAPSDFHLFRSLQHTLAGKRFKQESDVRNCIDEFMASKPEKFFTDGIRKLPERWQKVIDCNGEYFPD